MCDSASLRSLCKRVTANKFLHKINTTNEPCFMRSTKQKGGTCSLFAIISIMTTTERSFGPPEQSALPESCGNL